ncbi:MAG: aminotransferase class I/II-fold pyridoxal phosphate-dependent enzyme, partial [Gammaproteobacteria bacterium]
PAIAEATRTSLKLARSECWRRDRLAELSRRFRQGAEQLGLALPPSASAIQPVIIGDSQQAVKVSQALLKAGLLVSAIRPPTVPQGTARLRITFSALHEDRHIDRLLNELERLKAHSAATETSMP